MFLKGTNIKASINTQLYYVKIWIVKLQIKFIITSLKLSNLININSLKWIICQN